MNKRLVVLGIGLLLVILAGFFTLQTIDVENNMILVIVVILLIVLISGKKATWCNRVYRQLGNKKE